MGLRPLRTKAATAIPSASRVKRVQDSRGFKTATAIPERRAAHSNLPAILPSSCPSWPHVGRDGGFLGAYDPRDPT